MSADYSRFMGPISYYRCSIYRLHRYCPWGIPCEHNACMELEPNHSLLQSLTLLSNRWDISFIGELDSLYNAYKSALTKIKFFSINGTGLPLPLSKNKLITTNIVSDISTNYWPSFKNIQFQAKNMEIWQ